VTAIRTDTQTLPLITDIENGLVQPLWLPGGDLVVTLALRTDDGEQLVLPLTGNAARKLVSVLSPLLAPD
jgi:hypothetical protein